MLGKFPILTGSDVLCSRLVNTILRMFWERRLSRHKSLLLLRSQLRTIDIINSDHGNGNFTSTNHYFFSHGRAIWKFWPKARELFGGHFGRWKGRNMMRDMHEFCMKAPWGDGARESWHGPSVLSTKYRCLSALMLCWELWTWKVLPHTKWSRRMTFVPVIILNTLILIPLSMQG